MALGVRPGLVAVGVALVGLAVGGLVALFLIPIPAPTTVDSSSTSWSTIPGSSNSTEVVGPSSISGTFEVRWQSAIPISASLWGSGGCDPRSAGCPGWFPVENWTSARSGNWSISGTVRFPFLFTWSNPGPTSGMIVLTTSTTQGGTASLAPLSELLLGLGVGVLAFGGGIAVFLGLFLRGGVYSPQPAPLPRHPDDVEGAFGPSGPGPRKPY